MFRVGSGASTCIETECTHNLYTLNLNVDYYKFDFILHTTLLYQSVRQTQHTVNPRMRPRTGAR